MKHSLLALLGAVLFSLSIPLQASAGPARISEGIFYGLFDSQGVIPECTHPKIEAKIRKRFHRHTDPKVLERGLVIEAIDHIAEARYDIGNPSPLARRYCHARAHFNDDRTRTLYYFVEESTGFVGVKWNVEFCIRGLDPWRVYDGRCRVARPQ